MDRNYCFRRKRHSYAACDAALAASYYIYIYSPYIVYVCEHGKGYKIKCPPTHYINILHAMYGRMEQDRCRKQTVPKNGCKATYSLRKLKNHIKQTCGDKPHSCTAVASNRVFGDPCLSVYKYLELTYECKLKNQSM